MYFWDVQRECLRAGRGATLTDADVQGMRVGVLSPFFYNQTPERGGAAGSLLVESSYFRNQGTTSECITRTTRRRRRLLARLRYGTLTAGSAGSKSIDPVHNLVNKVVLSKILTRRNSEGAFPCLLMFEVRQ